MAKDLAGRFSKINIKFNQIIIMVSRAGEKAKLADTSIIKRALSSVVVDCLGQFFL